MFIEFICNFTFWPFKVMEILLLPVCGFLHIWKLHRWLSEKANETKAKYCAISSAVTFYNRHRTYESDGMKKNKRLAEKLKFRRFKMMEVNFNMSSKNHSNQNRSRKQTETLFACYWWIFLRNFTAGWILWSL